MRHALPALSVVAATTFLVLPALAKTVNVTDAASLTAALSAAAAGDEIVLAAGTYRLTTSPSCTAAGTAAAPIVVRSAAPLAARVELDAVEGFHVLGPNWHFEGLDIHGVCADDSTCEHAFHVVGKATGFVMRKNRVVDFNAQLKVNVDQVGASLVQPNGGLVEGNEVFDTHSRATANPVTKLNIDGVDDWIVRANYIHDAHKNGGDNVSYQSFMKGGGKKGLYERNLVVCTKDETSGGTRIGLSFGGGGTGPQFCAPAFNPATPCDPEMTDSTMRNNIIVNCSDVAIYLNKAKNSHLLYNTMIATSGVDFRFASSTGEADGNVLASAIRPREPADESRITRGKNLDNVMAADFLSWYVAPLVGDLRKKGDLSSLLGKGTARADVANDFCARPRSGAHDLGALQASLGDCDTLHPPIGDAPPGGDAGSPDGAAPPSDASTGGGPGGGDGSANGDAPASGGDSNGGCGCRVVAPVDARWSAALGVLPALLGLALLARRADRTRR